MISGCYFLTKTFLSLEDDPDKVSKNALIVIEMFVVLIYDRTNEFCRVNSATQHLFSWKLCCLESILPSLSSALVQQILGAAYQSSQVLLSEAGKKRFDMENLFRTNLA